MFEKLCESLTKSLCDRAGLTDWLEQIIKQNNQVDFRPQEANPGTWYGRATISRAERNQPRRNCWESLNYKFNQFLRQLIAAVEEQKSIEDLRTIFIVAGNENSEIKLELIEFQRDFLKKLDCVLW